MRFIKILVLIIFCTLSSYGQYYKTDTICKNEMSKLAFIVGQWEGKGWMIGPDGKKYPFNQTENIQFKLDSTAILIEGTGRSDKEIIHNAMAIVSYDKPKKKYTFQSYLQNGRKGAFKGELKNQKFYWYPNDNMRYIISINENGQWYEIGEMNREGDWFQFFEMTLNKKTK